MRCKFLPKESIQAPFSRIVSVEHEMNKSMRFDFLLKWIVTIVVSGLICGEPAPLPRSRPR